MHWPLLVSRVRCLALSVGVAVLFAAPAWSCGPDFPSAVFVLPTGPGMGAEAAFVAGDLGVPQPEYFTRHLVVVFDWLTGRGLSAAEQKQALAADKFLDESAFISDDDLRRNARGLADWNAARMRFGMIAGEPTLGEISLQRSVPGQQYTWFQNCLDDALANAARTLDARIAAHGASDPAVRDWVTAQDAVFTNCGDGRAPQWFGPGPPPPAPPQPRAPQPAPAGAPLWLRQDRAYQLAAASFYGLDYENAAREFAVIAEDKASAWSDLAAYLVARAWIREATIRSSPNQDALSKPQDIDSTRLQYAAAMGKAHDVLVSLEATRPAMRAAALRLQDFVDLRLHPDAQAVTLAGRLHGNAGQADFAQGLIDLTWLRTNPLDASQPLPAHAPRKDAAGLLDWLDAMNRNAGVDALTRWRAEHNEAWLLAALSATSPDDAAVPELLAAAGAVPVSSRGFIAITYHRLRLTPPGSAARREVAALLPAIRARGTLSTVNLFTELEARSAADLKSWLAAAQRTEVGDENGNAQVEEIAVSPQPQPPGSRVEDVCGIVVQPGSVRLFDDDAAFALNHDFSLARLADAAEAHVLPPNLQYQVAQAAWVRAVLLDRPEIARRMTPLLVGCRSAWKPVLAAYDGASAPDRYPLGLLAMMRFASTEPSVRNGEERRQGFATYDEFRQNWWCTTVPDVDAWVDSPRPASSASGPAVASHPADAHPAAAPARRYTAPLFLSAADRATAATEIAKLETVPDASTYFAQAALAWAGDHPRDPRSPELLGEAFRVLRNACRSEQTPALAHALFDVLHQRYPESPWTQRYKSWQ